MKLLVSIFLHVTAAVAFFVCISIYLVLICLRSPFKIWPITHRLCRIILGGAGIKLVIKNQPQLRGGPYLYLCNHQCILDPFVLGSALTGRVTAVGAENYFSIPIWGAIMRQYGIIPIKRQSHDQARQSMHQAKLAMTRQGLSILMFPEGTRTHDGQVAEFKKGAFHLALDALPTIVPMAIIGGYEAKPRHSYIVTPGTVTLRFGEAIDCFQYKNMSVDELRDMMREKIIALAKP